MANTQLSHNALPHGSIDPVQKWSVVLHQEAENDNGRLSAAVVKTRIYSA